MAIAHFACESTAPLATPTGWTLIASIANTDFFYYKILSSTGTQDAVTTTSCGGNWVAQIDTFK